MSSQSSFEEVPTPTDTPSTPQNHNLDLPPRQQVYHSASPSTSSLTPPPSSQNTHLRTATMNASRLSNTPDPTALSSPPPTVANGTKRDGLSGLLKKPTPEQVANASIEELHDILGAVLTENAKLETMAGEARVSAAHYKLRHNLLTIESEDKVKHLEVEYDMTLREVELLQLRVQDARDPPELGHYRHRCKLLEEESRKQADLLRKAKRVIISKEDDIADLQVEVNQLRERIRANRKHINEMRSPGGIFHNPSLQNSPTTPHQYRSTPKQTPMTNRSARQPRDHSEPPFAALLLADQVLRSENSSAPSTPLTAHRVDQRTPNRHNRGVQSLSSLQTTPGSARPTTSSSTLLPSAQFNSQADARIVNTLSNIVPQSRERRRKSRDSTISASDAEEVARATARYREESQEVGESRASQSATQMLRLDPRESFEVAASRTSTPNPALDKASFHQSKIFGSVTKGAADKRKRTDEEHNSEYSTKKIRANDGRVGLGIGFGSSRE